MPRTRLGPRTALRPAYAWDVAILIADLVAALGGSLEVRSHSGAGTTLVGRVPIEEAR